MRNRFVNLTLLALLCFGLLLTTNSFPARASTAINGPGGAIAFVRHTASDGDQIWLVAPDGSGPHTIYAPGLDATYDHTHIGALSWRPDASELAFNSDREAICSIWEYDLYSIRPNGGGYRRITNAPACQEFAKYPQGSVTLTVESSYSEAPVIYLQGASKPEFGPIGYGEVTFKNVADLGTMHQFPVALFGYSERIPGVSGVDVIAGKNVHVPQPLVVASKTFNTVHATAPSWNSDGTQLAYIFGLTTLRTIPAGPPLLAWGNDLLQQGTAMPMYQITDLAWSPSPTRANQLLYGSWDVEPPYDSIWLVTAGSNTPGQRLLQRTFEGQTFPGFAWLRDGSGFIYSRTDPGQWGVADHGNVYEYRFATGDSTPLTDFGENDYPMKLTVSPDGSQIAFERTTAKDRSEPVDLWVMNRNGGDQRLLARGAESPAWSPAALPSYTPTYLPLIRR